MRHPEIYNHTSCELHLHTDSNLRPQSGGSKASSIHLKENFTYSVLISRHFFSKLYLEDVVSAFFFHNEPAWEITF